MYSFITNSVSFWSASEMFWLPLSKCALFSASSKNRALPYQNSPGSGIIQTAGKSTYSLNPDHENQHQPMEKSTYRSTHVYQRMGLFCKHNVFLWPTKQFRSNFGIEEWLWKSSYSEDSMVPIYPGVLGSEIGHLMFQSSTVGQHGSFLLELQY